MLKQPYLTTFTTLSLLFALTATQAANFTCNEFCIHCDGNIGCTQCYKHDIIHYIPPPPSSSSSSAGLQQGGHRRDYIGICSKNITQTKCNIMSGYGCKECQVGYARDVNAKDPLNNCIKGTIANCWDEVKEYNGKMQCLACVNGYPSDDYTRCVPPSELKRTIKDCYIGVTGGYGTHYCKICKPGLMRTRDRTCSTRTIPGCAYVGAFDTCLLCAFLEGWYDLKGDGKCYQASKSELKLMKLLRK